MSLRNHSRVSYSYRITFFSFFLSFLFLLVFQDRISLCSVAVLELSLWMRLALHSKIHLPLPLTLTLTSIGIKGVCNH